MKSIQYALENEKPTSPITVSAIETTTIHFVSILRMSVGLMSEEIIVIRHVVIATYPAKDDGTPIDTCIVGHAEPSRESGKPRLMNDKYIIAISNDAINVYSLKINATPFSG